MRAFPSLVRNDCVPGICHKQFRGIAKHPLRRCFQGILSVCWYSHVGTHSRAPWPPVPAQFSPARTRAHVPRRARECAPTGRGQADKSRPIPTHVGNTVSKAYFTRNEQAVVVYFIPEQPRVRPHPNPPPEGEGTLETSSKPPASTREPWCIIPKIPPGERNNIDSGKVGNVED